MLISSDGLVIGCRPTNSKIPGLSESGNHHGEGQTRPDQQEGPRLLTASKATTRPAMGLHRSESSPRPVGFAPRQSFLGRCMRRLLRSGSEVIHEQVPPQHMSLGKPTMKIVASLCLFPVRRGSGHLLRRPTPAAYRSSVTAPPSLASGATVGRRQAAVSKTSIELLWKSPSDALK